MAFESKRQRLSSKDETCTELQDHPFTKEPGITDFAFVVEGKKLFVNKSLLAIVSPVFKKMFTSDFKEKQLEELPLPGKSFEDVVEFLKCIYPNNLKPINIDTVTKVLPLMHEYGCQRQLEQCQKFLVEDIEFKGRWINLEVLLRCLLQSKMYDLNQAFDVCLQESANFSLSSLHSVKLFEKLPISIKEKLHASRVAKLEKAGEELIKNIYFFKGNCRDVEEFEEFGLLLDKKIIIRNTRTVSDHEYNPGAKYKHKYM